MNKTELDQKLDDPGRPIVIEFWAGWCGPCRAMEPNLEKAADEFKESVTLIRINVDEDVEIAQSMKIYAIPTMVGFKDGSELFRKMGSQSLESLRAIFQSTSNGIVELKSGISPMARSFRLFFGFGLITIGLLNGINWLFILVGALIAFWGVYDRCPIYKSIRTWIKSKTSPKALEYTSSD
jgi:thioredoxin 1